MHVYDGQLPVPKEWVDERLGEEVTIRYVMGLDDLIEAQGIEEMNEYLDQVTGVVLTDISYAIGKPDEDDELGNESLIIEATGILEEF